MRLLAVAGPILCDVIPKGSQGTDQDPAVYPVSPQANKLLIKILRSLSLRNHFVIGKIIISNIKQAGYYNKYNYDEFILPHVFLLNDN